MQQIKDSALTDAEYNDYLQQEYNFYYEREREAEGGNPQGNAVLSGEQTGKSEDADRGAQEQGKEGAQKMMAHCMAVYRKHKEQGKVKDE